MAEIFEHRASSLRGQCRRPGWAGFAFSRLLASTAMSSHLSPVRTRFAPSPTGYLHVGTARTALYSYLVARGHGGSFVLRIEDTDVARNVEGGADEIARMLGWLGLDWDEGYQAGGAHGPYVQSERLDRYHTAVNALIAGGQAYPCYCTPEELDERRRLAEARGLPTGYNGQCRSLSSSQLQAYETEGRRAAVRFRVPDE